MSQRIYNYRNFVPYLVKAFSLNRAEKKIRGFQEYGSGWHFGEGNAFDDKAIQEALALNAELLGAYFLRTDAFPGLSGEIQVTAYLGDDCFEFTRETDGTWAFVHERLDEDIACAEDLSFDEVKIIAANLHERIWNTFALYQESSGIGRRKNLEAWPSGRQVIIRGFPLSNLNAFPGISPSICDHIRKAQSNRRQNSYILEISPKHSPSNRSSRQHAGRRPLPP